jgi:hypothetical protein
LFGAKTRPVMEAIQPATMCGGPTSVPEERAPVAVSRPARECLSLRAPRWQWGSLPFVSCVFQNAAYTRPIGKSAERARENRWIDARNKSDHRLRRCK